MTIEALYDYFLLHPNVETDTRRLAAGDIFFALKGPSFNGNQFAQTAIDQGASLVVIDEKEYFIEGKTALVDDVLTCLQQLAGYHRRQFSIPFLAITGSNGKTIVKEWLFQLLQVSVSGDNYRRAQL